MAEKIQTIEETSKRFKKQRLLASILSIVSFFAIAWDLALNESNPNMAIRMLATFFLILGLIWLGIVSVRIWWHRV